MVRLKDYIDDEIIDVNTYFNSIMVRLKVYQCGLNLTQFQISIP